VEINLLDRKKQKKRQDTHNFSDGGEMWMSLLFLKCGCPYFFTYFLTETGNISKKRLGSTTGDP